jgi:hypothetical protein
MKNKAFIYFLVSLIVFIIGLQTASFAWWGGPFTKSYVDLFRSKIHILCICDISFIQQFQANKKQTI